MSRNALSDLKHEATAECSRSDEARTVSFLNDLKNEPFNKLICGGSLKINLL